MKNFEKQKGITLIALIITIIVMLILVTVSVTVALDSGLFRATKSATDETNLQQELETNLSKGEIKVGKENYSSLSQFVASLGEITVLSEPYNAVFTFDGKKFGINETTTWQQFVDAFDEGVWEIIDNGQILYKAHSVPIEGSQGVYGDRANMMYIKNTEPIEIRSALINDTILSTPETDVTYGICYHMNTESGNWGNTYEEASAVLKNEQRIGIDLYKF